MGLIVLCGEAHWSRGLCLNNEDHGFVDPETHYSPCHDLFSTDEFLPDVGSIWYFYKLAIVSNSEVFENIQVNDQTGI